MSTVSSASAGATAFRTDVFVIGNLISLPVPGETEIITGGVSSQSHRCLRNRRITVYDTSGTPRGTAVSGGPGGASGTPGDWQANYSAGGSFPIGTYYATASRKRLTARRDRLQIRPITEYVCRTLTLAAVSNIRRDRIATGPKMPHPMT